MSLENDIKTEAIALGFVNCGISKPQTPLHYGQYLTWLEEGCQAAMEYMGRSYAIEARKDPTLLLRECQSILSLALAYPPPPQAPPNNPSRPYGRIAAYALMPDYHQRLLRKMKQLTQRIEVLVGHPVKAYFAVDSAPLLEKDTAWQSGLGWIGRNSLLHIPRFGTWVNLAEMLLDIDLEPDQLTLDSPCQNCSLCVSACPTGALRPDRSVDARRCLSYHTIENKGKIPEEFRRKMGNRVFGCDICQTTCPHNPKQRLENWDYLGETLANPYPDLLSEMQLTETAFKQKYTNTPILHSGYHKYMRNVIIAIGNSGCTAAIPALEQLSRQTNDPILTDALHWSLDQLLPQS